MKISHFLLGILMMYAISACTPQEQAASVEQSTTVEQAPASEPRAWLDAPLNGMVLPLAPYQVVFHIADPAGVALGELSINGQAVSNQANPDGTSSPATLRYDWNPPAPGEYTLQVRAQGSSGNWSGFSSARVTVGDPTPTNTPTLTLTPTLIDTLTPTITSTATLTPTLTPTPTMIQAPLAFSPSASASQFVYGSCGDDNVVLSVQVNNPAQIQYMELFVRLQGTSGRTEWDSYSSMKDKGNGLYQITVQSRQIPGADKFDSATLMYQFIATGSGGGILGRSEVYGDVTLTKCGSSIIGITPYRPPVVPQIITPTKTFIIIK